MDKSSFVGFYERVPVENDWHEVEICLDEETEQLMWKNEAGKTWKLDFDDEKLTKTDDDCYEAQEMQFEVKDDGVSAVIFQDEHYHRSGKTLEKGSFVGFYERAPVENKWHQVEICLEDKQLVWKNEARKAWQLDFDGDKLTKADDFSYDAQEMQFEQNHRHKISAVIFQGEHYYRKKEFTAAPSISSAWSKSSLVPTPAPRQADKGQFVGFYERTPVENEWHQVEICLVDNELMWKNEAGKTWKLDFDGKKMAKSDDDEYESQKMDFERKDGKINAVTFQDEHYYRKETIGEANDEAKKPDKVKCSFLCFKL